MSFILTLERPRVAFSPATGKQALFDETVVTCRLDIRSNIHLDMGGMGLPDLLDHGNFSKWVNLGGGEGVAVSGMTSCGAVFVANEDFSKAAAGHMSGDARFVEGWLVALRKQEPSVVPHYLVWGTGPDGSRKTGGKVLLQYMKYLNIPPDRAQAVVACFTMLLARSQGGVACAAYLSRLDFKRIGQAVAPTHTPLPKAVQERLDYITLMDTYDDPKLLDSDRRTALDHQIMMLTGIGQKIGYPTMLLAFKEEDQKRILSEHGRIVVRRFRDTLPADLKVHFLKSRIFQAHPDWK